MPKNAVSFISHHSLKYHKKSITNMDFRVSQAIVANGVQSLDGTILVPLRFVASINGVFSPSFSASLQLALAYFYPLDYT
jgi:hypothetical protein